MQHKVVWATSDDGSIEYIQITKEILQKAIEALHKSFYKHENISVALGLSDRPECFHEMDHVARSVAENGISIAAMDKATGKIAGVAFNKFQGQEEFDLYNQQLNSCKSSVTRNFMQCMSDIDKTFDVHEYCKVESDMEIMFVGIDPKFRKRGIAKKLFEVSIEVARNMKASQDEGIFMDDEIIQTKTSSPEIVTVVCTSFITQKIAKELNFKVAAQVDLDTFVYDGISLGSQVPEHSRILTYHYLRL